MLCRRRLTITSRRFMYRPQQRILCQREAVTFHREWMLRRWRLLIKAQRFVY